MNPSQFHLRPTTRATALPARPAFSLRGLVRAGLALAASLVAVTAHAQSNFATPYFFTTLAGAAGASGLADGTGNAARFFQPHGLAVDANGVVYVADLNNHTIRKITPAGVVTTFAGLAGAPGFVNGTGNGARFNSPRGVAVDTAGNVYVADSQNYAIRKITPGGSVSLLAGGTAGSQDTTNLTTGRFLSPYGVAVDTAGNVYVADVGNNSIRKVSPVGVVSTLAGGLGPTNAGSVDATGSAARFSAPFGVAVDPNGNVYVADRDNYKIRKITPDGVVTSIAGLTNFISADTDGTGTAARFAQVVGVAADAAGNVYVVDSTNSTIRKVTAAGVVTTLAGLTRSVGSADGIGSVARFNSPQGIAVDSGGNLYVGDTINHTIRRSHFPPKFFGQNVPEVYSPSFEASFVSEFSSDLDPITFQWQKNGIAIPGATVVTNTTIGIGTVVNGARFLVDGVHLVGGGDIYYKSDIIIANLQAADLGIYTVVATNLAGSTSSRDFILAFAPPPVFTTHPTSQSVAPGASATFSASATSSIAITYQWQKDGVSIPGATNATLTVNNVQVANLGNYTLVATNASGSTTSNPAALTFIVSTAGRLINLSILTSLAAGGDTFTMGYVVGGAGTSDPKPLVIRAVGPSLTPLGVGGALDDPKLELFAGQTKSGENDNWGGGAALQAAMTAVGAFAFTGPASRDAAVATSVAAGDNSVKVSVVGGGSGAVIAELYDATPAASFTAATPRLINVSVLKNLGTGLTAGFVVSGSTPKTVLVRAIGPTLGTLFGVPGVVADPQLALFNSASVKIGENDNWGGTAALTAAFTAVGAFQLPAASRDAAVLATLAPGNYTVQVSGVGGTTGVAIVEIYDVP